jgi:hypothetical protein
MVATRRTHVFSAISRAAFERIKHDLRAAGVRVPSGDACTVRHSGVVGSIAYSEDHRRLEIRIISKPTFVTDTTVASLLNRLMRRYTARP